MDKFMRFNGQDAEVLGQTAFYAFTARDAHIRSDAERLAAWQGLNDATRQAWREAAVAAAAKAVDRAVTVPRPNPNREPYLNAAVHYVSYGTPGGEFTSECRAAVVTAVEQPAPDSEYAMRPPVTVSLFVMNPTGVFFKNGLLQSELDRKGGTWHWADACGQHYYAAAGAVNCAPSAKTPD